MKEFKRSPSGASDALADPDAADIQTIAKLLSYESRLRSLRRRVFDSRVINEAAWLLMQDLFSVHLDGTRIRTKELISTSGLPQTTVLRYLDHLEKFGAINREVDPTDSRATLVHLSASGVLWMHEYYDQALESEKALAQRGAGIFALARTRD